MVWLFVGDGHLNPKAKKTTRTGRSHRVHSHSLETPASEVGNWLSSLPSSSAAAPGSYRAHSVQAGRLYRLPSRNPNAPVPCCSGRVSLGAVSSCSCRRPGLGAGAGQWVLLECEWRWHSAVQFLLGVPGHDPDQVLGMLSCERLFQRVSVLIPGPVSFTKLVESRLYPPLMISLAAARVSSVGLADSPLRLAFPNSPMLLSRCLSWFEVVLLPSQL